MRERLSQMFGLRSGEFGLVFLMAFLLFSNSLAQQVTEITAVSNFLSTGGVNSILIVWALDGVIIFGMVGLQSLVIDRYNRIALSRAILLIFALSFIGMRLLFYFQAPEGLSYGILFLISEQQWLIFPTVLWILANDVYNMAQAKRLFPIIAGGDFIGKLAGIGVAAAAPGVISSIPTLRLEDLFLVNAAIYLIAFLFITLGMRRVHIRDAAQTQETLRESLTEGWDFIRNVPVFRYLSLLILLVLVSDTIIEFHFLFVTDSLYFGDAASYTAFYSKFRLGMILASLLIQVLITNRIMASVKLKNLFFAEPLGAIFGFLLTPIMPFLPRLLGAVSSMISLKIPQLTLGDSARKAFQALVPEERRGRVSLFMDSFLFSLGTVFGCLLAGAILYLGKMAGSENYFLVYLAVAVPISVTAVWSAFKLRSVYDTSLFNWRLKRRERGRSVLDDLEF